jgi:hypothetical protein
LGGLRNLAPNALGLDPPSCPSTLSPCIAFSFAVCFLVYSFGIDDWLHCWLQ